MLRLFFALNLKEHNVLLYLFEKTRDCFSLKNKIKWVDANNLHITIFFIGEVDEITAKKIVEKCNNKFTGLKGFCLEYSKNLVFYNRKNPKVVGIEFKKNESILQLKKHTDELLICFDILPEERTFVPHLTFGRVKECLNLSEFTEYEKLTNIKSFSFNVDSFILFKSTLTSSGSIYEPLWQIKF